MKYPEFNGLNLTWEVREGLHKPYVPNRLIEGFIQPSLEAQAVDLSDQIAYICHDLDDGLDSGLIDERGTRPSRPLALDPRAGARPLTRTSSRSGAATTSCAPSSAASSTT